MARILIIEDEADIVLSLEEDLRRQGHQPCAARDGARGLELGRQGPWDLILLDVMLPKMDGLTAIRELRAVQISVPVLSSPRMLLRMSARPASISPTSTRAHPRNISPPAAHCGKPYSLDWTTVRSATGNAARGFPAIR